MHDLSVAERSVQTVGEGEGHPYLVHRDSQAVPLRVYPGAQVKHSEEVGPVQVAQTEAQAVHILSAVAEHDADKK